MMKLSTYSRFGGFKKGLLTLCALLCGLACLPLQAQVTDYLLRTNLHEPFGIAVSLDNTYFVTDSAANQILSYNPATGVLKSLAGAPEFGAADGFRERARFYSPQGIVALPGYLVVADTGNHLIRRVEYAENSPNNGLVSTLAGPVRLAADSHNNGVLPPESFGAADGVGEKAMFNAPTALAWDGANFIYIADTLNGTIRRLDVRDNRVITISSGYNRPLGVTVGVVDGFQVVFVADAGSHAIKYFYVQPGSDTASDPRVLAGSNSSFRSGLKDSRVAKEALFNTPRGIYWDSIKNELLISDSGNGVIRRAYSLAVGSDLNQTLGGSVDTYSTETGVKLLNPVGLSRDQQRFLLVADLDANSLMVIRSGNVQTPVKNPLIGSVKLNDSFACFLLTPLTNATFVNDPIIGVEREEGTLPYFTVGPTEAAETQPDPAVSDLTPPGFAVCQLTFPTNLLDILPNRRAYPRMTIKMAAFADGRLPSKVVTASFVFQTASPVITGTDSTQVIMSTETLDAKIYYTYGSDTNIAAPTATNGILYVRGQRLDLYDGTNNVVVRARAFKDGYLDSTVTTQIYEPTFARPTTIGVSRSVTNAPGSTSIIPVVINISPLATLATVQFRVELVPKIGANFKSPPTIGALPFGRSSDFFAVNGPDIPAPQVFQYTTTNNGVINNGVAIAYLQGGKVLSDDVTIAMLAVKLPADAVHGNRYSISVLSPSATSDGGPTSASIRTNFTPREVVVSTNVSYIVGDVATATGFNAGDKLNGDFGDGSLANNDVVQTLRASLRLAVPYEESDLFDAMDAFPLDRPGVLGGDRKVRFLDYMWTLRRAFGLEPNNFVRFWKDGRRTARAIKPGELTLASIDQPDASEPAAAWNRQALLYCVPQDGVNHGDEVGLDLMMRVRAGFSVSGLQFTAKVQAVDGNAPSPLDVRFSSADNPRPPETSGSSGSDGFYCVWNVNDAKPSWRGLVKLGQVRFRVPPSASFGQQYSVTLSAVDGAPDLYTTYEFETARSGVGVQSDAVVRPNGLSDEWLQRFFPEGGADSLPSADSDGDGLTNLLEYESGTDPKVSDLLVKYSLTAVGGVRISWFGGAGLRYVVESSSLLQQPDWKPVSPTLSGQGSILTYEPNPAAATVGFFRVQLVKPSP